MQLPNLETTYPLLCECWSKSSRELVHWLQSAEWMPYNIQMDGESP